MIYYFYGINNTCLLINKTLISVKNDTLLIFEFYSKASEEKKIVFNFFSYFFFSIAEGNLQ